MNDKTYSINVRDLNKIPTDRLETFFQEFQTAYSLARRQHELLQAVAQEQGVPMFPFPDDDFHWVDDGKGEIKLKWMSAKPDGSEGAGLETMLPVGCVKEGQE